MDDLIINEILRREGSAFTDHPADRGGPTKYGITQRTWDDYRRRHNVAGHTSVEYLTEQTARTFYRQEYVTPWRWIENTKLRTLVIDSAVNHGSTRAVKWLQQAAGVTVDGAIGPVTREAVNQTRTKAGRSIEREFFRLRAGFYIEIVLRDNSQLVFLRGWINRLLEFA